ncbi:MAG: hypothetical protein JOY68_03575 [Candidatus Dormibacteraeota bacterium]|nr:hypothetical protein [Candidatus Dormibacteraeota bacterium]
MSAEDRARFERHLQRCERCAAAYATFRSGLAALQAMPAERMPRPVHIPSGPVPLEAAVVKRSGARFKLPALGVASLAGAGAIAAVALVIVLAARGAHAPSTASNALNGGASGGGAQGAPAVLAPAAACGAMVPVVSNAMPPSGYTLTSTATATPPGLKLVLATQTGSVRSGHTVSIYAAIQAQPGTAAHAGCLNVTGLSQGFVKQAAGLQYESGGVFTLNIPSGIAPGTVLHITMTTESDSLSANPATPRVEIDVSVSG